MDRHKGYFEANKKLWDAKTPIHFKSHLYGLEDFKEGASSLRHIEEEELGGISGKSILHLMCHFGMDTMSFTRKGGEATGIDISEEAINTASKLAKDLNLDTKFIQSNVYNIEDHLHERFDIVFTSYGVVTWLPDLDRWVKIIKKFLKDDGFFYMVEFHPFIWMFDEEFRELVYDYFHSPDPYEFETKGTYADSTADINQKEYVWNHSLSDLINAFIDNGFKIEFLHEFPYSTWNCFPDMKNIGKDKWIFENFGERIPYLFSFKARTV